MVSTFESLPNEVQQLVLNDLEYEIADIVQCTLVCKSWKRIYEQVLYSDVTLYNLDSTTQFIQTLEANRRLGTLVTNLEFESTLYKNDYAIYSSHIMKSFSYLPNLRQIHCSEGGYFAILKKALLMKQLPSLNIIGPPRKIKERELYVTCAILLRNRLEILTISDSAVTYRDDTDEEDEEEEAEGSDIDDHSQVGERENLAHFYRIYDNLDYFQNLKTLNVVRSTNHTIDLIEKVTKRCPSLQSLYLNISPGDETEESVADLDSTIISNPQPMPFFTKLNFTHNIFNDPQLLNYIINKFPNLQTLFASYFSSCTSKLDESGLCKFLNYLTRVDNAIIDIPFNFQTHLNCIESFWKVVSQSRMICVNFNYQDVWRIHKDDLDIMSIHMENKQATTKFTCSPRATRFLQEDIIEKCGKYIDHLKISGLGKFTADLPQQQQQQTGLFDKLIFQPLQYCVRLERLSLEQCALTDLNVLYDNSLKKQYSINHLRLKSCTIDSFKIFFRSFACIKDLELSRLECVNNSEMNYASLYNEINLPETDIGNMLIAPNQSYCSKYRTLLLKLTIQKRVSYFTYHCDSTNDFKFKPVSREEFGKLLITGKCFRIAIICKSLKSLTVQYDTKNIRLVN